MSYAIANIIHGIPLTEEIIKICEEELDIDYEIFFETFYTASGLDGGYCGVRIFRFNECQGTRLVDELVSHFTPTQEQCADALYKYCQLPPQLMAVAPSINTYLIWSSS